MVGVEVEVELVVEAVVVVVVVVIVAGAAVVAAAVVVVVVVGGVSTSAAVGKYRYHNSFVCLKFSFDADGLSAKAVPKLPASSCCKRYSASYVV